MQRWLALVGVGLFFAALSSCSPPADQTEPYPNRPIEVVVPFAPGGGSDTFARIIKAEIDDQQLLPHPLVIINAPGAGGTIGSRRVMGEKPDGYTVLLLHDGIMTAKYSGKVLYGPSAFDQVAGTGRTGMVIAVHEDSDHESLTDLLVAASTDSASVTFAANLGAPSHFMGLIIQQEHGTAKFRFGQTGGGADRFAAIKGQHADATAFSFEEFLRFKPDGIRALAYLGHQRHPEMPELATAIEQGINAQHNSMQFWWMPKGTPPAQVERFADVLEQAMASPSVQSKLMSMQIDPVFIEGEALSTHLRETDAQLAKVDPRTDSPLPNIPVALAVLTLLTGVTFAVLRLRSGATAETLTQQAPKTPDDNLDLADTVGEDSDSDGFHRWPIVAVCSALVFAYAVCVIQFKSPLGITTALFLIAMGLVLTWQSGQSDSSKFVLSRSWALVVVNSCIVGVVFHLVFTKLFEIGL